jgi:monoamine oxidase
MPNSVIIIGAGMAGLSAALHLHRAGWRVSELEARGRVGGRVYTFRNFSSGQHAEAGGEFIEHFHHRLRGLADEFGLVLERVRTSWDEPDTFAAFEGRAGRERDEAIWGTDLAREMEAMWAALARLAAHVPDPGRPHAAPEAAVLDQRSAAAWIAEQPVPRLAKLYFQARLRSEYTVEAQNFSLLDLARNAALLYSDPEAERMAYRIRGGNDLLPRAIAAALPEVHLNTPVTQINVTGSAVTVSHADGALTADYAVLAIPLTVARHLTFDPPLPPAHRAMMDGLSYGAVTKVCIQYRRRWWQARGWRGHMLNDAPLVCTWEPTTEQDGERGILTVYTGGAPGAAFVRLSEADRIAAAVDALEKLFPGSKEMVERAETIAWPTEPHTLGAYAAFAPGDITRHWQTLFTPADRLYFAGEHAAVYQGYMEGAVESGQRVANELLQVAGL